MGGREFFWEKKWSPLKWENRREGGRPKGMWTPDHKGNHQKKKGLKGQGVHKNKSSDAL